jgi:hypothetical protein
MIEMKAIINGLTVEGTPQELADYQKIMDDMRRQGIHIKPPLGEKPLWVKMGEPTLYPTKKCGHLCNCTGACYATEKLFDSVYKNLQKWDESPD